MIATASNRQLVASMQERVHQVHGMFSIESQPGIGTKIRAVVPLVAENGNALLDMVSEDAGADQDYVER
jgi:signal transduction histidine kinase